MRSNFVISIRGYAILYVLMLVHLRSSSLISITTIEAVSGQKSNIKHLRIFGYKLLVPIFVLHRTKMGPQMREGIYIRCKSLSIIKYLDPATGNLLQGIFKKFFTMRNNFHVW